MQVHYNINIEPRVTRKFRITLNRLVTHLVPISFHQASGHDNCLAGHAGSLFQRR